MYTSIYQNSYVAFIVTFIVLCIIFYFFKIGYTTTISNGNITKKFSWKYPLAISLIVWVVWYFWLYPPSNIKSQSKNLDSVSTINGNTGNNLQTQQINMYDWN
ncbi:hypothetical protein QLL95_gp0987 [Cotonvirus japonicus]|uniref:Uncharacterized protein n=1 Tax=Cotonvirus japonicus TaxID=2811091 RepID=A0ABM7NSP3_9VIRU|nr:hypothetical protein QLL95_gp0987 [Cotonvirus japonicus]BCS83136.1 hypothetical protein [Cotonvirus japonicus]